MRNRTLKRTAEKQIKKAVEKQVKAILKEFIDIKKDLMEVFGLVVTLAMKIEEFEKETDFAIAGKDIKAVYTKMKNDLGRLYEELKKREEDMQKLAIIKNDVAVMTRAKLITKFEECRKKEKEAVKINKFEFKTTSELGIPDDIAAFFNAAEITAKCLEDYVNSEVLTVNEKMYMKRFITYASKYIDFIEKEMTGGN